MADLRPPALPIVYINLDSGTDRRERMQAEFTRMGLAATRFNATRWTALPDDEKARFYSDALNDALFHKPLVNGEKGCYTSHLNAWQQLLDSDQPALVVLEDDVKLKPEFAAVIEAIAALPSGWDMIKLIGRVDAERKGEKARVRQALTAGTKLVDYKRMPSLTAGYVVSRSGAQKLLHSRIPFGRPIDVDLRHWWENGLRIQGVVPAAIALDDTSFQSSIGDKASEGLARQWRKFRRKFAYTVLNAWHRAR